MPIADSFTALGRGNGFPFCATKKDVSVFDNWITLGGVSSGSASRSQINESLRNAMKLWWNLNSITGTFSVTSTSSESGSVSVSATNHELILKRSGESDPLVPRQRSCRGTSSSISNRDELVSIFSESDSGPSEDRLYGGPAANGDINIGNNNFIVRMYNGSTDDEDNFVGYGVSRLVSTDTLATAGSSLASAGVLVGSYLNGTDESGQDPNGITFDLRVFQTTLGDIPFRSKILANADESGGALSLSVSELSASATANSSAAGPPVVTSSASCTASITDIDFYTYS